MTLKEMIELFEADVIKLEQMRNDGDTLGIKTYTQQVEDSRESLLHSAMLIM